MSTGKKRRGRGGDGRCSEAWLWLVFSSADFFPPLPLCPRCVSLLHSTDSLIRAHSRVLHAALNVSDFPDALASTEVDPSIGLVLPPLDGLSGIGSGPGTPRLRKKKLKKRVVADIEVIGAEYEEQERIMEERRQRAQLEEALQVLSQQQQQQAASVAASSHTQPQPETIDQVVNRKQIETTNEKVEEVERVETKVEDAPQPVSVPAPAPAPASSAPPVDIVAPVVSDPQPQLQIEEVSAPANTQGASIAAIPSTDVAPSTSSPDRAPLSGRSESIASEATPAIEPQSETRLDDKPTPIEKPVVVPVVVASNDVAPPTPAVLPRSIFVNAPATITQETSEPEQEKKTDINDTPAVTQNKTRSRGASLVDVVAATPAPIVDAQPTSQPPPVAAAEPTPAPAPVPAPAPAAAPVVTPVRPLSNKSTVFMADPKPFTPMVGSPAPGRANLPFVSPAVNDQDMAALNSLGTPGLEKAVNVLKEERQFPPQSTGNLSHAMEAAAAADPTLRGRGRSHQPIAQSMPRSASILGNASSAFGPPDVHSHLSQSVQPRQVLLERHEEYDIFLNQLASSPASGSSPQLRALTSGRLAALPTSPSTIYMRPQLASLGLDYVSNYFNPNESGPTRGLAPSESSIKISDSGMGAIHAVDSDDVAAREDDFSSIGEGVHIKTLIRPVVRESPKELMKRQDSKCAGCGESIFLGMFTKPRYCHYTGGLYCTACHLNEKRPIPGKVLTQGDSGLYKVCTLATSYLDTMYSIPSIPMAAISPGLYQTYRDLGHVFVLRQQLAHIRAFILTCKKKEALLKLLGQRQYMLNDTLVRTNGSAGSSTPPKTAPPPMPSMMAQSVTSDAMPSVGIGSYHPQRSLLPQNQTSLPTLNGNIGGSGHPSSSPPASDPPVSTSVTGSSRSSRARVPASPRVGVTPEEVDTSSTSIARDGFDPLIDDPILNPTLRDMYSLRDIVETLSGAFLPRLTTVVRQLMAHIVGGRCDLCSSKAFFCECTDCPEPSTPIFSFQLSTVVQCSTCAQSFHRSCFEPSACPKCARMAQRKLAAAQRIAAAKAAGIQRMNSSNFPMSSSPVPTSAMAIPSTPVERGRLGFMATGVGSARSDFAITVDRTRSGSSRGSSPVRQMNERLANKRSASPAPQRG